MWNKTKVRFRIGAMFLIFLMLFICSFTPNISADDPKYTAYGSTADTVYDTTPTADAECPSNFMDNFTSAGNVVFKVDYTFENDHASDGSYHMVLFWVTRTAPTPDNFQTDTGWVYISPENSDGGYLTLSDYVPITGYSYNIEVECRVKKNYEDITYTSDWDSYTWSV